MAGAGKATVEVQLKFVLDESVTNALRALGWAPPGEIPAGEVERRNDEEGRRRANLIRDIRTGVAHEIASHLERLAKQEVEVADIGEYSVTGVPGGSYRVAAPGFWRHAAAIAREHAAPKHGTSIHTECAHARNEHTFYGCTVRGCDCVTPW